VNSKELVSPEPEVALVWATPRPLDNAVATARTCYSSRPIGVEEVAKDERARALRDRLAAETYAAGHHTTLQHAHFQFVLSKVSRQAIWSFLHAHPFYNSEQVSQRYVEVKPGNVLVPALPERERARYLATVERQHASYRRLVELLTPAVQAEYFRIFPARAKEEAKHAAAIAKKAQEVARYVLPIATHAHLYHTVSGLTLHRYRRMCETCDVPAETRLLVEKMCTAVAAHDPLFLRNAGDPLPLEHTPEARLLAGLAGAPTARARAVNATFDASLGGRVSRLVDHSARGEQSVADAVRLAVGALPDELPDAAAIAAVLRPRENRLLGDALTLTTLGKVTRALSHAHYTFRKKLSHSADSQDQRHRMAPATRPVLATQYAGGEPDAILPVLIERTPAAREEYETCLRETWRSIDALLSAGVSAEKALYLLPNAFPIRFEESGDLLHLHHKWTTRLCYTAQEEIWAATVDEVAQVREVHPELGRWLLPPCGLRADAGARPVCPEGPRFCGVPVWRLTPAAYRRIL
jgi:thymidylate synthase ThyX